MNAMFLVGDEPFEPFCTRKGGTAVCALVSWTSPDSSRPALTDCAVIMFRSCGSSSEMWTQSLDHQSDDMES